MKKITVKDVAAACGCSVSTVSKTLNGTDRVGKETADKIREIAAKMGYQANLSAQSLAGRSKKIGIYLFENPPKVRQLFELGISEAMSMFKEFDIGVNYYYATPHSQTSLQDFYDECDAWIVTPGCLSEKSHKFLSERTDKKPLIFLQEHNENGYICSGEVTVDAVCVGRMAAQMLSILCKTGNVGMIIGYPSWIHLKNVDGFKSFAKENGLVLKDVAECHDDMQTAKEVTRKMLSEYPEIEGLFVSSYVSSAVCKAVKELDVKVKIIGTDMFSDSAECLKNGELSALFFQNQKHQAFEAVKAIVDIFRGVKPQPSIQIKPELILKSNMNIYMEETK